MNTLEELRDEINTYKCLLNSKDMLIAEYKTKVYMLNKELEHEKKLNKQLITLLVATYTIVALIIPYLFNI